MIISKLSKKHPCEDICDDLAGKYPKSFVFTGWHPQCFCYVTPILGDEDEMAKITDAFLEGKDYEPQFEQLEEYPKGFEKWVKDHKKQIEKSIKQGKEPYFIKDNKKVVEGIIGSKRINVENKLPPKVETYIKHSDSVYSSPLHGSDELKSNVRIGENLARLTGESLYLLPKINPDTPKGVSLRLSLCANGTKNNKNPDGMSASRLWDIKECSFKNTPNERSKIKSTIENHIKKAKKQADNFCLEVPEWVNFDWIDQIVGNYLNLSKSDHWIAITKSSGNGKLYKK